MFLNFFDETPRPLKLRMRNLINAIQYMRIVYVFTEKEQLRRY